MKNKISSELIKKYQRGECSPAEEAMIDDWYRSFEDNPDATQSLTKTESDFLERKMLTNIRTIIKQEASHEQKNSLKFRDNETKRSFLLMPLNIAASLATILLISAGLFFYWKSEENNQTKSLPITHIANNTNAIVRQLLNDGTTVWLKPNTHIDYPSVFSNSKRELKLKGEAFFEVAKDKKRPFIISTGNIITQVVGTSFTIKAYESSASIEVAVMTGKVSVSSATKSVLLRPNEKVTYLKKENRLEKVTGNELSVLDIWQNVNVSFENTPIGEVIHTLNKKFNVKIEAENSNLLNCTIRADFSNQNLPEILEILSESIEATYELQQNSIVLKGEGCANN